jgi:hypothetical protein
MRIEIAIVALALLLTACNDEGSLAVPAPSVSHWKIAYSPNMPAWMSGTEGNWYFDFPNQNGVHYVYKVAPAVRVGQTITMLRHHRQGKLRSNGRNRNRPRAAVFATAGRYAHGAGAV